MKVAGMLLLLLVVGLASVEAGPMRKRFLIKELKDVVNSVGDFFTGTYNSAKNIFNGLVSNLNFDDAVQSLIPLIHSDMTVSACVATCKASATVVLGQDSGDASELCTPLCEGALAKLESIAG